jgi:hypothetical protein
MSKKALFIISVFSILLLVVLIGGFSTHQCSRPGGESPLKKDEIQHITSIPLPGELYFAGERVPLENFDVSESLERELMVNTYWHSQTLLFIKKSKRYFAAIEPILRDYNVPDDMKYLAVAESGLANVVSPAGATGFWQILDGTANDYRLEVNDEVDERFHLEKSTKAASQFLKDSYRKYGSWALAAASYNMGRGNIAKQIERQKSSDYYNMVLGDETGRYLYRLIALKLILEDPEKYGYYLARDQYYTEIPSTLVEVDSAITSMPDFAHYYGINYKMLKELNPWLRDDKLTNPYRKKYQIKIIDTNYRKVSADTAFYKPRE